MDPAAAEAHPNLDNSAEAKRRRLLIQTTRRSQVAALILQRVPLHQIAVTLQVTKRTVLKDKKRLLEDWSREAGTRIDLQIGRELAAMDRDELALRRAMEKEPEEAKRLRFFDRIAAISKARRELLGLDAAVKVGVRFEGQMDATLEIRDREYYKAMLSDPAMRAAMLSKFRAGSGMPEAPHALPEGPNTNGNGKAH